MTADTIFPLTNAELGQIAGPTGQVRFPASFDEFWDLLEEAEFKVEYFDHEIIATMSYESDLHSDIATQISFLLKRIFHGNRGFRVRNGNRPVCIPECEHAVFNPDGSVVSLPSRFYEYRPGMNAELTPALVFEVLSKTTRTQDFGEKLPCYKRIPSLRQILFVDSKSVEVLVFERVDQHGQWVESRFNELTDRFQVFGKTVSLAEIYEDSLA